MVMKKYCKNCGFRTSWEDGMGGCGEYCDVFCKHSLLATILKDHVGYRKIFPTETAKLFIKAFKIDSLYKDWVVDRMFRLNEGFNCPFYRTKWWKFWVKVEAEDYGKGIESFVEEAKRKNKAAGTGQQPAAGPDGSVEDGPAQQGAGPEDPSK